VARCGLEVADVFRRYGEAFREHHGASLSTAQRRVMSAIEMCRTAALGGHIEQCDHCDHQRISYNSCGNRHCTKCQSLASAQWLENRQSELLDVVYFHVVFTIPQAIAAIAYQNKEQVYNILFQAASETLRTIAADPKHLGAEIGFFSVLHTWGQTLTLHPHIHCVVAGGGLSLDGTRWISCRPNFFLPVRVLSRLFRRLFLKYLEQAFDAGKLQFFSGLKALRTRRVFLHHLAPARKAEWRVYAKPPFGAPDQALNDSESVLKSMARYAHRAPISDDRLLDIEDDQVAVRRKDHRDDGCYETITPAAEQFHAPDQVLNDAEPILKYMERHSHSVAISNDRLLDIEDDKVAFRWKDYRDNNREKIMVLPAHEFIRRFLLHVLPHGFQRIRYYGFLANRYRKQKLALCRELLRMPPHALYEARCEVAKNYHERYQELTGCSLLTCPVCHEGRMLVIEVIDGTRRARQAAHRARCTEFADPLINDTS
jgi:Putative transposase/Transposase zinc-binding domain